MVGNPNHDEKGKFAQGHLADHPALKMTKTMDATLKHKTANTYRVNYKTSDCQTGSCLARGKTLEEAKENFKKHYRAKPYEVKFE